MVSPEDGSSISLIMPYANYECMNIFLQEVAKNYSDYQVIMFMDKAGWHRSKDSNVPDNIIIEFLPPYSPELNPTEMFWKVMRARFFHNVFFNSMNAVEQTLVKAIQFFECNKSELESSVGFDWIKSAILEAT